MRGGTVELEVVNKPRTGDLSTHHRPADPLVALEHEHLPSGACQVYCAHQAVVPGADYNRVIMGVGYEVSPLFAVDVALTQSASGIASTIRVVV